MKNRALAIVASFVFALVGAPVSYAQFSPGGGGGGSFAGAGCSSPNVLQAISGTSVPTCHQVGFGELSGFTGASMVPFAPIGSGVASPFTVDNRLKNEGMVYITDYAGADPLGVTSSTTALNNALATGKAVRCVGTYLLTDMSTIGSGQDFGGWNKSSCVLNVNGASFNMAAAGILRSAATEPGANIHDLTINCIQPTNPTNVNAYPTDPNGVYHYPSAINYQSSPRTFGRNIRIQNCWNGLDAGGDTNSGGSYFENAEISAYNLNSTVDGSQDSNRYLSPHIWPFSMNAAQSALFYASTTGLDFGRCDACYVANYTGFVGLGMSMHAGSNLHGTGANPLIYMTGTDFDSFSGAAITAGELVGTNVSFAGANSSSYFLNISGASTVVTLLGGYGQQTVSTANNLINIDGARLEMLGYDFNNLSIDQSILNAVNGANVTFSGHHIYKLPNVSYAKPVINVGTGNPRLTATNIQVMDKGTGTGNLFSFASDGGNFVDGVIAPGWSNNFPPIVAGLFGTYQIRAPGWGGTGLNASVTGGSKQIVQQPNPAGAFTVGTIDCSYLTTAGTGCSTNVGTSGATLGLLNANKTDSGANTFSGVNAFSAANTHSGAETHSGVESFAMMLDASAAPTLSACGTSSIVGGNEGGIITITSGFTTRSSVCAVAFSGGGFPNAGYCTISLSAAAPQSVGFIQSSSKTGFSFSISTFASSSLVSDTVSWAGAVFYTCKGR